jgi:hypothetical protein
MSEDLEALPEPERSRVRARDRKVRGPKVVMDNPGLRNLALQRAQRLREKRRERKKERPAPGA